MRSVVDQNVVMRHIPVCIYVYIYIYIIFITGLEVIIGTHHITAVHITPQKLNNFSFHYFIIIHSYPILFHIITQK